MVKVKDVSNCDGCPLQQKFPNAGFVPVKWGSGNRLVVGEAAGADEELQGKPFVGKSGQVLQSLYRKVGVNWNDLTVINTLSCRPPNNIYPTSSEARSYCSSSEASQIVDYCKKTHLDPVLNGREWTRIDALGEHALQAVTGKVGISKWRGSPTEPLHKPGQYIVMPTLHPAYLMRQQELIPAVVSDLKKTMVLPPENYTLFASMGDVQAFTSKYVVLDIETNMHTQAITHVGISDGPYKALCIPWRNAYRAEVKRILLDAEEIVGHNLLQFDLDILCRDLDIEYP